VKLRSELLTFAATLERGNETFEIVAAPSMENALPVAIIRKVGGCDVADDPDHVACALV
jgi:hypothetical protein